MPRGVKKAMETAAVDPQKINWKGNAPFDHHLFKGSLEYCLKRMPHIITRAVESLDNDLVKKEHTHIFHSKDSRGRPQTRTNPMAGHFHDVTFEVIDGVPVAKCGPALHYVDKRTRRGVVREVKPVVYRDFDGNERVDDHTHEMEYVHSEKLVKEASRGTVGDVMRDYLSAEAKKGGYELRES